MSHPRNAGYEPGNHWVECQRCGVDYRANEIKEDRQKPGLKVCPGCWDPRHPQEFVKAVLDNQVPKGPINPPPTEITDDRTFSSQRVSVPSGTFNTNTL